jgi:hypothetical protein
MSTLPYINIGIIKYEFMEVTYKEFQQSIWDIYKLTFVDRVKLVLLWNNMTEN